MIINIVITLYTSRIVLQTLGVTDYGIYNLVGGVVVLFSFLNNAMTNTTQRFLNYEIVSRVKERVNNVFSMSLNIHILISLIVIILSETIGLWFLNYKLAIPEQRIGAANIVYQLSVLTTIINIIRIPYNAIIIAKERMSFYAFLGILESSMKLLIAFILLMPIKYDLLVFYSVLLLIVTVLVAAFFVLYCNRVFYDECKYVFKRDQKLFKQLLSFSGWSLFGQVAVLGSTQGINMVLNIFIGVAINATMGIANQVNAAIYNFISNMQVAFNPQIVQTYAGGKFQEHKYLVLNASKFSLYLFLILAVPFLVCPQFILHAWLGKSLPPYVATFTQIIILNSIINAMVGSFWMSVNAIGNIKTYQLIVSFIILLSLPISYLFLKNGFPPYYVLFTNVVLNFLTYIYRFWYINKKLNFTRKEVLVYFREISSVLIYVGLVVYLFRNNEENDLWKVVFYVVIVEIVLVSLILLVGVSRKDFYRIKDYIFNKLKK